MRPEDGNSTAGAAEAPTAANVMTVICEGCEREVPNGAIYCPHCCGEDGREGAVKRGGFVGGVMGMIGGALIAAFWSSYVGPERGTWGMVFGITFGSMVTGVILGMVRQRKE